MNVEIREFQPGDELHFRALNEAWITASFKLENEDIAVLGDPQHHILDTGGHIYFAMHPQTGNVLGCCALLAMGSRMLRSCQDGDCEELPWAGTWKTDAAGND